MYYYYASLLNVSALHEHRASFFWQCLDLLRCLIPNKSTTPTPMAWLERAIQMRQRKRCVVDRRGSGRLLGN